MISIIICSRSIIDFENVKNNIANTIGVLHEVIRIDNSKNQFSISRAYNSGAIKSKYPFFCFLHEDIKFQTENWGLKVIESLQNPLIGLIGVAGGRLKTKSTGPTWWNPIENLTRLNIIQHLSQGGKKHLLVNPENEISSEVVTLDGVFLCCRKEVWEQYPFDEKAVKEFHFYDLDFSLSVGQKYKVAVTYDILLEHFSEGKNDKTWAEQADIISRKWRNKLPQYTKGITKNEIKLAEHQTEDFYLHKLFELGANKKLILKYICIRISNRPKEIAGHWYFINKLQKLQ